MKNQNIHNRLRKVFVEILDQQSIEMDPSLKKGDIESWDSFGHINLMLGIESEFGVEFDSDEIGTLVSVGQIIEALQRRLEMSSLK
jgi:acyl carrier protein